MRETSRAWVREHMPEPCPNSHKYDRGTVLVVAGSAEYRGAATLTCLGALRSGAGLVCLFSVPEVIDSVAAYLPEVIFPSDITAFLERPSTSLVVGPGLGTSDATVALVESLFNQENLPPTVVDADALTIVAAGVSLPPTPTVLTPHAGELARLLGHSVKDMSRMDAVEEALEKYDCTILYKGPRTLVGTRGITKIVNSTGNAGMATAGSGDVLSGVIGTLLAQGVDTNIAAGIGAYWHGLAGDICLEEVGYGFSASQLGNMLPKARKMIMQ